MASSNPGVRFEVLSKKDYDRVIDYSTRGYAEDIRKTRHVTLDKALEMSAAAFRRMLPEGIRTPNNTIYRLIRAACGTEVGFLWITLLPEKECVFISDIEVYPEYQGQGFGTAAMGHVEQVLESHGWRDIRLSVFKHNPRAVALYKRLSYIVTDESEHGLEMLKRRDPA